MHSAFLNFIVFFMCIYDSVGIKVQYVCYMVINLQKTWYCLFVYQHNEKYKDLLTDPITWFLLCDWADELFTEACSDFPWGFPGWLHNASNHVRELMNYSLIHVQAFYEDLLADSILISLMGKRWCIVQWQSSWTSWWFFFKILLLIGHSEDQYSASHEMCVPLNSLSLTKWIKTLIRHFEDLGSKFVKLQICCSYIGWIYQR